MRREFVAFYQLNDQLFEADTATGLGLWDQARRTVSLRHTAPGHHQIEIAIVGFRRTPAGDTLVQIRPSTPEHHLTLTVFDSLTGPRTYSTRYGGFGELYVGVQLDAPEQGVLAGTFRGVAYRSLPGGGLDSVIVQSGQYRFTQLR
jgi:hypothetical protein